MHNTNRIPKKGMEIYMNKKYKTKKKEKKQVSDKMRIWVCAICNFVVAAAVILGLFIAEPIRQFDFNVGDIATENINATRDIEDRFVTDQLINEARDAVQDIYVMDNSKTALIYDKIRSGIQYVEQAFNMACNHFDSWKQQMIDSIEHPGEPNPEWEADSQERREYDEKIKRYNEQYAYYSSLTYEDVINNKNLFDTVFTASFWNSVSTSVDYFFSIDQLKIIASATDNEISLIKNNVSEIVLSKLNPPGIRESELESTLENIREMFIGLNFDAEMLSILDEITAELSFNVVFDAESTEEARRIAAESVKPIVYKKGQTIITAGQPITEAQYRLIEELGLLASGANEYSNYISLSVAILIICAIQCLMFISYKRTITLNIRNNIIIALLMILSMYLYILVKGLNRYICTSMLAVIMITMLIDGRAALIVGIPLSLFSGMYASGDFAVTFTSMVTCTMCACLIKKASSSRSMIIIFGLAAAATECLAVLAMEYYMTAKFDSVVTNTCWILVGGVAASVLAIGLLPVFENLFGVITPIRLLELSNQSQPVLKRLQIEATGTYYHSIIVGNMAETAANDIGADGLLARIGSYYHDIGKLMRPQMFKENQTDDYNPHDDLPPEVSAKIIISHVKDGLYLAEQNKVPKILYQFIEEHHGSTLASYFYYNACNLYGKENVNVNDYKYSGKTPSTKECAIVMLADTVEAAVRSMKTHGIEEIRDTIDKLVEAKIDAGQLDNCPLTFKEITTIKQSFLTILSGAYHQRVEYPKLRENNETEPNKN